MASTDDLLPDGPCDVRDGEVLLLAEVDGTATDTDRRGDAMGVPAMAGGA